MTNRWLGWCLSLVERLANGMGGVTIGVLLGTESQGGFHRRFVADMLEVTVGAGAGPAVEVATDGCLLGVLVAGWEGIVGGCAKGVG